MNHMRIPSRAATVFRFAAAILLGALLSSVLPVQAQKPDPPAEAVDQDPRYLEELEVLTLRQQLRAAEVRAAESRLELAKRQTTYHERMRKSGYMADEFAIVATSEVLDREADLLRSKLELRAVDQLLARAKRSPAELRAFQVTTMPNGDVENRFEAVTRRLRTLDRDIHAIKAKLGIP